MAIRYAESLLASAKGRYRNKDAAVQTPTPAAVDWDTITDTLVDTPAERRNRELRFVDDELGLNFQLTRRPYVLEPSGDAPDIGKLLDLRDQLGAIPPSVRARILPALRQPWSLRCEFLASVAKRHPLLMEQLWEEGEKWGPGWIVEQGEGGKRTRVTGLPDALLLLEEEHRMARPTADRKP